MIQFSYLRLRHTFLILLPVFAIIFLFFIKVLQVQQNQESFFDGALTLQISRGWLEGKELLRDNLYGDHAKLHNYYFVILLGFLTKFSGMYGLFIAYLGLVGLLFWNWKKGFKKFGVANWGEQWLAAIFYAFGPIAYFIFLDRFGWHPEQYFIPLMALLALSLAKRQIVASSLLAVLIFMVKETSAALIFCLLAFCSITDLTFKHPGKATWKYIFNIRNIIICGVCFVLFCASMWWLSHLNDPQPSRLALAMKKVWSNCTPYRVLVHTVPFCTVAIVVTTIGLFPFIPMLRFSPQRMLTFWTLVCCCTILSIVYFVESLLYFTNFQMGLSYPSRISGIWAFIFSAFIFFSYRLVQSGALRGQRIMAWVLTGCLLQFLIGPFLVTHSFTFRTDFYGLKTNVTYLIKTRLGLYPYVDESAKQLHSLAKQLPVGADVVVPTLYLGCFQNVYPGTWDGQTANLKIYKKSLLFVYEKHLINKFQYYKYPKSGYTVIPNQQLLILANSKWYNQHFK